MFGLLVKEDQQINTQYRLLLWPCLATQSLKVGLYCWEQHILNIRFGGIQLKCPAQGPVLLSFKGAMQTIKGEKSMDLPSCNVCKPQDAAWQDTLVVQYWLFWSKWNQQLTNYTYVPLDRRKLTPGTRNWLARLCIS